MVMTPEEIQQKQFRVKFRGFDVHEVDLFLEQVADQMGQMLHRTAALEEEIKYLKQENRGFKDREETFKKAMLNSQKVLEQMKDNARKSAEVIIANAEVKAEKMLNRAHNRLAQLHEDIAELKRQRIQLEVQIRSVIEAHTKLLEVSKEGMEALDEEDKKLAFLNNG